jgi:hypothetical protein
VRFKCKAHYTLNAFLIPAFIIITAIFSAFDNKWIVNGIMDVLLVVLFVRFLLENGSSMNSLHIAFKLLSVKEPAETMELVRKQKINAKLNEALHAKELLEETYAKEAVQ